jgi:hypothetical protein
MRNIVIQIEVGVGLRVHRIRNPLLPPERELRIGYKDRIGKVCADNFARLANRELIVSG